MACDTFSREKARKLLRGRFIYFFGDSNTRAMYKDLTWLLEDGRLLSQAMLKTKNEESHANDVRLSNGKLHNGRDYKEVREYKTSVHIKFEFITRLYQPEFRDIIVNLANHPDVLIFNSCVWDLTRWGASGVQQFKDNIMETLVFLKSHLANTRIIWLTTLPPAFASHGGFLTQEIEFMRKMLPWHIVCANKYASDLAIFLKVDVLDLHYHFRFFINHHTKDGIHWNSKMMRYATNLLLTHLALNWYRKLPGKFCLDSNFIKRSQVQLGGTSKASMKHSHVQLAGTSKASKKQQGKDKHLSVQKCNMKAKRRRNKNKSVGPVQHRIVQIPDGSFMF